MNNYHTATSNWKFTAINVANLTFSAHWSCEFSYNRQNSMITRLETPANIKFKWQRHDRKGTDNMVGNMTFIFKEHQNGKQLVFPVEGNSSLLDSNS